MEVCPSSIVGTVLRRMEYYKERNQLESILDIGAGKGIFGFLARNYFNQIKIIDAVEPKPCKSLYDIYDSVIEKKIEEYIDEIEYYDIILIIHVMEHLRKDIAIDIIEKLKSKCDLLIFSSPATYMNLKPHLKDLKTHKSFFTDNEIKGMNGKEVMLKARCKVYEL